MQSLGLAINPRKSYLIGLKKVGSRKQLRVMMEPFLQVGRTDLPVIGLQGGVGFEIGGIGKVMKQEFEGVMTCLAGSALKPQQRVELFRSFILPRWRFKLVLGRVSIATTCLLNWEVWRVVRRTLHTPFNLSKEWIHLEMKKGGLGIPDALEMTYLEKAWLAEKMSHNEDGNVRLVYDTGLWDSLSWVVSNDILSAKEASISDHVAHRCRISEGSDGASSFRALAPKPSLVWEITGGSASAALTGRIAEDSLFSQASSGNRHWRVASPWPGVVASQYHLVEHVEEIRKRFLISFKAARRRQVLHIQRNSTCSIDVCEKETQKERTCGV